MTVWSLHVHNMCIAYLGLYNCVWRKMFLINRTIIMCTFLVFCLLNDVHMTTKFNTNCKGGIPGGTIHVINHVSVIGHSCGLG